MSTNSSIAVMLENALSNGERCAKESMTFTRCGNCKYKKVLDNGNIVCQRLALNDTVEVKADFFCAYGVKAEQKIRIKENER